MFFRLGMGPEDPLGWLEPGQVGRRVRVPVLVVVAVVAAAVVYLLFLR